MLSDPAYAELLGKMEALPGPTRRKALRKGLRAMGNLVAEKIREKAPRQKDPRGGDTKKYNIRLHEHVRVQVKVPDDANAGFTDDKVAISFDKDAEYIARLVEYGHAQRRGKKGGKQTEQGDVEQHPFVRPAFDATKEPAQDLLEQIFTEEIAEAMNG